MGDTISRSDVQHAVQSALHDVRNDVSRMSHIVDNFSRVGQDIQDLSRRLQNLERNVNQIQNTVINTLGRSQGQQHPDPQIANMANDLYNLKTRFSVIEGFAKSMSDYMRRRHEEEEEDRQYRTA